MNVKFATLTYMGDNTLVSAYADTVVFDPTSGVICAVRFGGYPEAVHAIAGAIYEGGKVNVDFPNSETSLPLHGLIKEYRRDLTNDGEYTTATLIARDPPPKIVNMDESADTRLLARTETYYLFCQEDTPESLFAAIDQKTAVPLIPAFQDYLLRKLTACGVLRRLERYGPVNSLYGWALKKGRDDQAIIDLLEQGLQSGEIQIPGDNGNYSAFDQIHTVMDYLNTFGPTVANRIRNMFLPLFEPERDTVSRELLAVNETIRKNCGYALYEAQLAVAESMRRRLDKNKTAIAVADCGIGKTKIGIAALYAHQAGKGRRKAFNIILCPAHVAKKWVREIEESLPNTAAAVVHNTREFNRLYSCYERSSKSVYAVISKENARDGYMRAPAVRWSNGRQAFVCPVCGESVQMSVIEDGTGYRVNADQFYFKTENNKNHRCEACGSLLWTALNPGRQSEWVKIGNYGFVHRRFAARHLERCKLPAAIEKIEQIAENPDGLFLAAGACRRYPLSTYIKKHYRGRIDALIADELHQYAKDSGQGDAMGELAGCAKKVVGMTATLINGYSSGIFHLLYRICPRLMEQDGQSHQTPRQFDMEYGVIEEQFDTADADYNSNRRASKVKKYTRQRPGVSPLVYSRFLIDSSAFLSLEDVGKELPDYEEIPIPLEMDKEVKAEYEILETKFKDILKNDRAIAQKLLSVYLNLLLAYPDQPYGHPPVLDPRTGDELVIPRDTLKAEDLHPKYQKVLEIADKKIAAGERVLIYTNWVRLDSQEKLNRLLTAKGYCCGILHSKIKPEKREEWVSKKVENGLQVLITNPRNVETGLDLNDFTTIIFFDTGTNLFTFRQAAKRSYRINQTSPRIEVYLPYYKDTMQQKMIKLMASKLAVAGIIEGHFSQEGLAAMSDCQDMMTLLARELALGIKDNVEDIGAAFQKMAIINHHEKDGQDTAPTSVEPNKEPSIQKPATFAVPIKPVILRDKPVREEKQNAELQTFTLYPSNALISKKRKRVEVEDQLSMFDLSA